MALETKPTYQEAVIDDEYNRYFLTAQGAFDQTTSILSTKKEQAIKNTYVWMQTVLEGLIVDAIEEGNKQLQFTPPKTIDTNTLASALMGAKYKTSIPLTGNWTISWDLETTE